MYNIGLEAIRPKQRIPQNWAFEQIYELSNDLNKYCDALINMCVIRESLKKYGKTPQLMDLVGASFEAAGVAFSMEGIWESIKNFFKWIKDKIVAMWNWFTGLFKSKKDDAKKADEAVVAVDAAMVAIQSNNPEEKAKAKAELDALVGMFANTVATSEQLYIRISTEGLSSVTLNIPDPERMEIIEKQIVSLVDKVNKCRYLGEIIYDRYTSPEVADTLKTLAQEISEYKKQIEWPGKVNVDISLNDLTNGVKYARQAIHNSIREMQGTEVMLAKLKTGVDLIESKLLKDPDNEKFKNISISLKSAIGLITDITFLGNKYRNLLKVVIRESALALRKLL